MNVVFGSRAVCGTLAEGGICGRCPSRSDDTVEESTLSRHFGREDEEMNEMRGSRIRPMAGCSQLRHQYALLELNTTNQSAPRQPTVRLAARHTSHQPSLD